MRSGFSSLVLWWSVVVVASLLRDQIAWRLVCGGRLSRSQFVAVSCRVPTIHGPYYSIHGLLLHTLPTIPYIAPGHPFFRIFRIFRILRTQPQNPQRPKKRPPVEVVLFLGSCKRFAFSNVFWHCQLHHDELQPINTGNDRFSNRNLTENQF